RYFSVNQKIFSITPQNALATYKKPVLKSNNVLIKSNVVIIQLNKSNEPVAATRDEYSDGEEFYSDEEIQDVNPARPTSPSNTI
ncbi:hypothetical protein HDU92_000862, partial [Lobulomyces angularis]